MRRLTLGRDGATDLDVLVIGAHPDDIEIGCAGTILSLIADGRLASVTWVVLSSDAVRNAEARTAADAALAGLERREVIIREGRDSYFPADVAELKAFFEALKDRVAPDLILTHRLEDRHQDHRLTSELTWQTFRDHLILEYEIPKYEGDLGTPNVYVEIPDWATTRKLEIVMDSFPSQVGRSWFDAEVFRSLLRLRAIECRAGSGYAEAFQGRKLVL